ncbi:type II toxin-antitoxin system VapC family toxin [Amnibacterium sp.]|uniref:type II toxin-antitoxin system VapC family toxin n=1 Tax=Amnibacterium sp. TaxID=1872496 RepID=UPI003F7BC114
MTVHYIDTSALVKLVVAERYSDEMWTWVQPERTLVTSDLTRTELMRAVTRVHPLRAQRVRAILDSIDTVGLTARVLDEAGRLATPELRSLDAIHLAVALSFGDDLSSVVTYENRLGSAAAGAGLAVEAPGATGADHG